MKNEIQDIDDILYLKSSYSNVAEYTNSHSKVDILQFEQDLKTDLSLFAMLPSVDFFSLDIMLEKIHKVLPHILEIFNRPLMHLKTEEIVASIETVQRIDKSSINHLAKHTNIWSEIENDTVRPSKLLTKVNADDYGIYENIIFCYTVDKILHYVNKNKGHFDEVYFNRKLISSDIFSKVNHFDYYTALAKMHISYIHLDDTMNERLESYKNKLAYISETLHKNKKRRVYQKNKKNIRNLPLRKTNILSMHKDYKHVYKILKYFSSIEKEKRKLLTQKMIEDVTASYFSFTKYLLFFSLMHFNFEVCNQETDINNSNLNVELKFKKWKITISNLNLSFFSSIALIMVVENMNSNKKQTLMIYPNVTSSSHLRDVINNLSEIFGTADEYVVVHPFDNETKERIKEIVEQTIPLRYFLISINNIDSFRRFQQLVLRSMIKVDDEFDICPFCGASLQKVENNSKIMYFCKRCREEIIETICDNCGEKYIYTNVDLHQIKNNKIKEVDYQGDKWLFNKVDEGRFHYRNITDFSMDNKPICPHCHK